MSIKKIIQKGEDVLREIAKEVPAEKITTPEIQKILSEMKESLDSQDDGVAIAAPQIGVPMRIFVVSRKVFEMPEEASDIEAEQADSDKPKDLIFINPEILKLSKKREWMEEGCLSVRWLYGQVKRSTNATVRAYNEKGEQFTRGAGGLLAQIFQHEIDHLEGTLFVDKAEDIQEIPPDELQKS